MITEIEKNIPQDAQVQTNTEDIENSQILAGRVLGGDAQTRVGRGLKSRHTQMIALGSAIGTGLFVGSGVTLAKGGPAFLLSGYVLVSVLVFCVVSAITDIATYLPVHGATMSYYGRRYVSNSLGFAMGWLYFYSFGILVPFEITAAGLVIQYWNTSVHIAV